MFYCQLSNALTKPNETSRKLVTHIRPITYRRGDRIVGQGWEIVKEVQVSAEAYNQAIASGFQPAREKAADRFLPFVKREDKPYGRDRDEQ